MRESVGKDLNLLVVFSAIWDLRNLSKAAERLFLSQSAVSHALNRLRDEMNDPLFVREPKGVTPTDFAKKLAPAVQLLLSQADELYRVNKDFDPKTVERNVAIAAGDYFSIAMLERFVAEIMKRAPKVRLQIQPVANVFQLNKFESGEIDLAVTAIEVQDKQGFHCKEIQRDKIAVCLRKEHPALKKELTKEVYLNLKHINVSNFGATKGVVDEQLEKVKLRREVKLVACSFFDAAKIVRITDLALSAPSRICEGLAKEYQLEVCALPFSFKTRSISLLWHERTNLDPFHAWVRKLLLEIR